MLTSGAILQNRYQIICLLGRGGFGAVYQARDLRLGHIVALKENVGGDPRQFQQEAMILANLRHSNLPRVSDHITEPNGAQYLIMDFVEGEDLESVLQQQGALPEAPVLTWFDQILDAVAYLHSHNIIHRDIKPANIKITPAGEAVLVDFGIAKIFQPGQGTLSGARAVSPGYAAPEQYRGGTDQRSDIYSLGATLYALLTGSDPPDAHALERGTATLTPPRALSPSLSVVCEQVVLQAMAIQPSQRFQGADAMRRAIKRANVAPTLPTTQPPLPQIVPTQPIAAGVIPRLLPIAGITAIIGIVCLIIALMGYSIVQVQSNSIAKAVPTPTPTHLAMPALPSLALPLKPTDTPLPLPILAVTRTVPFPTDAPILPTARPSPTKKPTVPLASPTPTPWPDVYVLRLETDPPKVRIGDKFGFKVTLFNNLDTGQTVKWYVRIFQCPEQCQNYDISRQSIGDSPKLDAKVPTGISVLSAPAVMTLGPGRCDYIATPYWVQWVGGNWDHPFFALTEKEGRAWSDDQLIYRFSVCN